MTSLPASELREGPAVRRFLTLMFSDLNDSTRLGATLEAEHYAALVAQLREAYLRIIPIHAGTVVRIQGDGVLAIFGHPEALEDDGRRATEAALDLHKAVRELLVEPPMSPRAALTLHTGIHAGLVLLSRGDAERGRFELMGNAPNIAARLSDLAGPDEILVSEETLGPERHFFRTGEARELSIQGTGVPLMALPVVDRAGVGNRYETRIRRGLSPFVGRLSELDALEQSLKDVLSDKPKAVALTAGPGLGKTRLAQEFLQRCSEMGCRVLRGFCESYGGSQPLQPFLQIMRTLFDLEHGQDATGVTERVERGLEAIGGNLKAHRRALLQALSVPDLAAKDKRPQKQESVSTAIGEMLGALARERPLVLFLDDWQWADDASHQVLHALQSRPDGQLFILLATRGFTASEAQLVNTFQTLVLEPLSESEAAQTARRLLPSANPFLITDICAYGGGNPLFIEELCHRVAHSPASQRLERLQGGAAWLRVLIEARVMRLPETQAALVRTAAVIGSVIPIWLFERITGCNANDEQVRALGVQDLIFQGDQPGLLRFKHGLTRDAIYEAVGLHQRRALHRQIAEALLEAQSLAPIAGENTSEALAYHFAAAGQSEQAAHYAEIAGDRAVAASALDRAQAQYRSALASLDELEETPERALRWITIMQRLGLACVFDPSRNDLPLFERALELAHRLGDPPAVAKAQYWLAYMHYALGHTSEAVASAELAIKAAELSGDDKLFVQVHAMLGQSLAAACDYPRALTLLDGAIAVKQKHRSGSGLAVGLAYSLACKAYVLADKGDFAAARRHFEEALALVGSAQHEVGASIRGWYATVLLWQGRWEESLAVANETRQLGERVRSLFTMSMGRAVAAYARWQLDTSPDALNDMIDTLDWLSPRGNSLFVSLIHGRLAEVFVSCGRAVDARASAARALRRGRQGDMLGAPMACRAMARLEASRREPAKARRWIARAMRMGAQRESSHEQASTLLCSAEIELLLGEAEQALQLAEQAMGIFERTDMTWHLVQARRLCERARAPDAIREATSAPEGRSSGESRSATSAAR